MSDNIATSPDRKSEYPQYQFKEKEKVSDISKRVSFMNASDVVKWLEEFKDLRLENVDKNTNTYLMTALYQRALNLMGYSGVRVDGFIGEQTQEILLDAQRILGLVPDGKLWWRTTQALMLRLSKVQNKTDTSTKLKKFGASIDSRTTYNTPSIDLGKLRKDVDEAKTKIDFASERLTTDTILQAINKDPAKSVFEAGGIYIDTKNGHAIVRQSRGEYYVYGKPEGGSRTVYRIKDQNVIGTVVVDRSDTLSKPQGEKITAPYTPSFTKKIVTQ